MKALWEESKILGGIHGVHENISKEISGKIPESNPRGIPLKIPRDSRQKYCRIEIDMRYA